MSDVRDIVEMNAEAERKGCIVVWPGASELFIDIDCAGQLVVFDLTWPIFLELHPGAAWRKRPSPSGKEHHFHIIVTLRDEVVDDKTRIYLQAMLGSDAKREMLALKHLRDGHPPTVFFEKEPWENYSTKTTSLSFGEPSPPPKTYEAKLLTPTTKSKETPKKLPSMPPKRSTPSNQCLPASSVTPTSSSLKSSVRGQPATPSASAASRSTRTTTAPVASRKAQR